MNRAAVGEREKRVRDRRADVSCGWAVAGDRAFDVQSDDSLPRGLLRKHVPNLLRQRRMVRRQR